MSPEELLYYRERGLIERQRAAESTNLHAKQIHLKLADLYERLVDLETQPQPHLQVVEGARPSA